MCEMDEGSETAVSSETFCRTGMGVGDPGAVYLPCIYSHARRYLSKAVYSSDVGSPLYVGRL